MEKYSAIGPNVNAGKKARAAMMAMTVNTNRPNVDVSVLSVPALSGMYFLLANKPAIATGPMIGKNLPNSKTKPVVTFQKILLPMTI